MPTNAVATYNSVKALEQKQQRQLTPVEPVDKKSAGEIMEQVIAKGDLAALSAEQRARYYTEVCQSLGANPLTKPFDYITLDGKLTLYPNATLAAQLRELNQINIELIGTETVNDVYIVRVRGKAPNGRSDESIAAVPLVKENGEWKTNNNGKSYFQKDGTSRPLTPDEYANAVMKCETKAKRRVTLSLVGLGYFRDISEKQGVRFVEVSHDGEILDQQVPIAGQTMRALHAAGSQHGLAHDDLHDLAVESHGVASMAELTEYDAQAMISDLEYEPVEDELATDDDAGQLTVEVTDETITAERAKVRQTWLGNIAKATKIERLDQIMRTLQNVDLLSDPVINQALDQKRLELDPAAQ